MKLREFVANSLPRVRGRRKKGHTNSNGTTGPASITAAVAAAAVATSPTLIKTETYNSTVLCSPTLPSSSCPSPRSRQDNNGNWFSSTQSRFGFFEKLVGKDSPVKRLLERDRRASSSGGSSSVPAKSEQKIAEQNKARSSSRSTFIPSSSTEPSSPYYGCGGVNKSGGVGVRSPPLGEKPVFHSQHASPVSASWGARGADYYSDWDCCSLYAAEGYGAYGYPESLTSFESSTPGSQREGGPRSRSRIRTNPWLPSPRPSPYSVRSLSSPCPSSRSPSPSSSPPPPSSSDSTSPLTSFSSNVTLPYFYDSQLQRHRRHRRHHSEVKASELTRPELTFDLHLTDTEQYYSSTLDSGIGDATASSSGEKDKQQGHAYKKQRSHHNSNKRRSSEKKRDLACCETSTTATAASVSSSLSKATGAAPRPRFRTKNRSVTRPTSSTRLIANRDSRFWDSDSSSRSPPSRRLGATKDSLHFDLGFPAEGCVIEGSDGQGAPSYDRSQPLPGTPREPVSGLFFSDDFLPCGADSVAGDFGPVSGSFLLSPCDDICIITSNIEQLAQNISSEYEDGWDVGFHSMHQHSKQSEKKRRDSLSELLRLDSSQSAQLLPCGDGEQQSDLCCSTTVLDYNSFAEPLHCKSDRFRTKEEEVEFGGGCGDNSPNNVLAHPESSDVSTSEDTPTVDVAVQTDFADDEEEDASGSDWLASPESGSDWPVSIGSGSDCPASTSSGSDWPTSTGSEWQATKEEGSGCATEEESGGEEEGGRGEVQQEAEEEPSVWVEGSRLWIIPDIMQNSTDTGYSSLSRDGRIITDDNNNNSNATTINTVAVSTSEDSSDSSSITTTTTNMDQKTSKTFDSDMSAEQEGMSPSSLPETELICSGAIPKITTTTRNYGPKVSPQTSPPPAHRKDLKVCGGVTGGDCCSQRISCKLELSIKEGRSCHCPSNTISCVEETTPLPMQTSIRFRALSDSCASELDFLSHKDKQEELVWQPRACRSRPKHPKSNNNINYEHVVPYPYDVRRFSDGVLPCEVREGSVSPGFDEHHHDRLPSGSGYEEDLLEKKCCQESKLTSITPRRHDRREFKEEEEGGEDDVWLCLSPSTNSGCYEVITTALPSSSKRFHPHVHSSASSMNPLQRSPFPLRSCGDLPSATGRSLHEVKASLEDKVQVLRHGKHLVSRKLREAREEEMMRQQQKLRFQHLLDIHRKKILLDTLQDLRHRLESQSARLQASYSAVINLQKRCI